MNTTAHNRTFYILMVCLIAPSSMLWARAGDSAPADSLTQRVVSLDYCADQFVLKMLSPSRILAVSPDAKKTFSYMRASAEGIRQVRPVAEDILAISPDLVVRSYGGGPRVVGFFERAGIPVVQVPFANSIEEVRRSVLSVANGLAVPERGAQIVAEMDRRLNAIDKSRTDRTALYMTSTGATSGPGTLIHDMLLAAGFENFETRSGWRFISLERLAYAQPDVIAAAFLDEGATDPALWSAMRHPVAKKQLRDRPTVELQGAWTSCGGWFLLDAIEALAARDETLHR